MKTHTCMLAPTAFLMMAAPAVAADLVFTNQSGATTTLYGQINLTYQGVDDGTDSYQDVVDNSNSGSRVGLWFETPLAGNRFRFNLEAGLGLRNTADTSQTDDEEWIDWQRTDIRKLEGVYSGAFGAFWFGQGSMATDGVAEIDNSGTSVAGYVNLADTAGGYEFRDGDVLSGITIGDAFKDFDGPRRFRIRYDTPEFSGFYVSAAYGQEVLAEDDDADYYDAALRYSFESAAFKIDAGLGYAWKDADDADTVEQVTASGSLTHIPTGLSLTLAAGDQNNDGGNYVYTKIGWSGDLISYGSTAVALDYYDGSDFEISGSSSTSWGFQAVQRFDDLGLEAYLGYRDFAYEDVPGADYQDLNAVLVGARWKF